MAWLLAPLAPTFEAALRDVHARGADARIAAAERLAETEPGQERPALDGLVTLARDRDARVRAAALRGLRRLREPEALECMLASLDDGDGLVRELSVVALGEFGGARAQAAIARALRNPHPEVRFQAVASYLDSCENDDASAALPLLNDPDAKVRANAARALTRFARLAEAELKVALADPDASVRGEAALALGRAGDPSGARQIGEALGNPELMIDALDVIGELGLRELSPAVAEIANSVLKPLGLKVAAARALLRLGDPEGLGTSALRDVLRAFRSDGRSYAVQVVGELRVHRLDHELVRLARRPRGVDLETLVDALRALATESPSARAALESLSARSNAAGPDFPA